LHTEVALIPVVGHLVGLKRALHSGHFSVESGDLLSPPGGMGEMNRDGISTWLEIEVGCLGDGSIEEGRFDDARRFG
jgi:hypothetical protein